MIEYSVLNKKLEKLTVGTDYSIKQQNGQRKYGPPKSWNGPPPPKGCEVFIGKLPRDLFEDELVPVFSAIGCIYEMRMMLNFSGSNRGYAFLTYSTRSEATAAINILHNYEIRPGNRIGVVRSVDNCHLYIGGIPTNKTEEDISVALSVYVFDIVRVILNKDPNTNLNSGYAHVEFRSHRAAAMARRRLVPGFVQLFGRHIEVEWAEMEQQPNFNDVCIKRSPMKTRDVYKTTILENDDIFSSPVYKLQEICKGNFWPTPKYSYKKYPMPEGPEMWLCNLEFIGANLPHVPIFLSPPSLTLSDAQTSVASGCLAYIQEHKTQLLGYDNKKSSPIKASWIHADVFKPLHTNQVPMKIW